MLTPGEFVVRRDGSNIADALKHFGAKDTTPVGGDTFNIYEATSALATAMQVSRRQAALGAV
jgi:hypothetical protein